MPLLESVGNAARTVWLYLALDETAKTGMVSPGDVTLTLHRETSAGFVAAVEAITWTEIGVTGYYTIAFTPLNSGLYVLTLKELNADSFKRIQRFEFDVHATGAVFSPAYANAFCAETDVERWLQKPIDGTTSPDDTETTAFAEARAALLMSLCAGAGYSVTPATVVSGSRIEDMLREANAIGAALDWTIANEFGRSPSLSERAATFGNLWTYYVGGAREGFVTMLPGVIEMEIRKNLASLASDHILSGDTVAYDEGSAPTSAPIGVTMADLF